jgi:hypothetical protein
MKFSEKRVIPILYYRSSIPSNFFDKEKIVPANQLLAHDEILNQSNLQCHPERSEGSLLS